MSEKRRKIVSAVAMQPSPSSRRILHRRPLGTQCHPLPSPRSSQTVYSLTHAHMHRTTAQTLTQEPKKKRYTRIHCKMPPSFSRNAKVPCRYAIPKQESQTSMQPYLYAHDTPVQAPATRSEADAKPLHHEPFVPPSSYRTWSPFRDRTPQSIAREPCRSPTARPSLCETPPDALAPRRVVEHLQNVRCIDSAVLPAAVAGRSRCNQFALALERTGWSTERGCELPFAIWRW